MFMRGKPSDLGSGFRTLGIWSLELGETGLLRSLMVREMGARAATKTRDMAALCLDSSSRLNGSPSVCYRKAAHWKLWLLEAFLCLIDVDV